MASLTSSLEAVLPAALHSSILSSNLLLVGSGGIGCELLKNLSMSSFNKVTVIDLDTIDVSNLNRQFLFRSRHVGMAKCEVATAAVMESTFSVDGKAEYKHFLGNVKDNERFPVSFFKSFDCVLNALDNVDARRHVNRMCLAADVPLVEAGTTGYLGQCTVIMGKQTECYECEPKPTQKVYPICTIRSTPSMPVHCIVWGKELFKLMFGKAEDSMLFEGAAGDEGEEGEGEKEQPAADETGEELVSETSLFMEPVVDNRPSTTDKASTSDEALVTYLTKLLHALFSLEVQKQLDMDRYKTAKKTPAPLPYDVVERGVKAGIESSKYPMGDTNDADREKRVWTTEENVAEVARCTLEMYRFPEANQIIGEAAFDKDDMVSMRFVTAASNLRCNIFKIDESSLYTASIPI